MNVLLSWIPARNQIYRMYPCCFALCVPKELLTEIDALKLNRRVFTLYPETLIISVILLENKQY